MSFWFSRHPEELFPDGPSAQRRVRAHLRRCDGCRRRYDDEAIAERLLFGGSPTEPSPAELARLKSALPEVLLGSREAPPRRAFWGVAVLGSAAALALVVGFMFRPGGAQEWTARGRAGPGDVVRVFCAEPQQPLRELGTRATCAVGGTLVFAAGSREPGTHVALSLDGAAPRDFPVAGAPGREAPLPFTIPVEAGHALHVRAAFGADAETARASLSHGREWNVEPRR